jgi:5-methylthioribose kinase
MTPKDNDEDSQAALPILTPDRPDRIRAFLKEWGWLDPGETLAGAEPAGESIHHIKTRVRTNRRSLILKQFRPSDKVLGLAQIEQKFYERAQAIPSVAGQMPDLLRADPAAGVILLKDYAQSEDFSNCYLGGLILPEEMQVLGDYLRELHSMTEGEPDPDFANREIRELNARRIFDPLLAAENGSDLDRREPGLQSAVDRLRGDSALAAIVRESRDRYLTDGPCLLHGDFFPGCWLRTPVGIRVVNPEFCFYGDPAFDVGVALAHLALARQSRASAAAFLETYLATLETTFAEAGWIARFAAVEIIRRLVGADQLPIPPSDGFRAGLLERSRRAMLESSLDPLWA